MPKNRYRRLCDISHQLNDAKVELARLDERSLAEAVGRLLRDVNELAEKAFHDDDN